jgi:signal transduction histidine kinase
MSLGSLRVRLLIGAGAFIIAAVAVATLGLTVLFRQHVETWVDAEINADLDELIAGIDAAPGKGIAVVKPPGDTRFAQPFSGRYWQVMVEPAGPVLRSRSLWDFEIKLPAETSVDDAAQQYLVEGPDGQTLYLLQRRVKLPARLGGRTVIAAVGVDDKEVRSAVWRFASVLAPSLLVLGILLAAASLAQVAFGLRPLTRMRRDLAAIGAGERSRLGGKFPDEVQPLADEIDALLDARDRQIEKARARAADLAHGLKTPLQALAGDAERLRAKGERETAEEIAGISAAMQRHVERYLARARTATADSKASASLHDVTARVLRVVERTPDGERLRWSSGVPADMMVRIDAQDLTEAAGNLIENAARHARSAVHIAGTTAGGFASLTITDDGPGIPEELRDEALRRGGRLDASGPGAGLGLAIAAEIAEAWNGKIDFARTDQGFSVSLTLPLTRGSA